MAEEQCSDCGSAEPWWYALRAGGPYYCKRCWEKSGRRVTVEVDIDTLRDLLEGTAMTLESLVRLSGD
jgi:hypothetical protein